MNEKLSNAMYAFIETNDYDPLSGVCLDQPIINIRFDIWERITGKLGDYDYWLENYDCDILIIDQTVEEITEYYLAQAIEEKNDRH